MTFISQSELSESLKESESSESVRISNDSAASSSTLIKSQDIDKFNLNSDLKLTEIKNS